MRGKELTYEQREQIIGDYLAGLNGLRISTVLAISRSTVYVTIDLYKKLVLHIQKSVLVVQNNYLHNLGLLTYKQRIGRYNWCKAKLTWKEEWKQIVWSDESRFTLFKSDGRIKVYNINFIKPIVKYNGGSIMFWGYFSWYGIGPLVVVDETMNSDIYVKFLAQHLVPWIRDNPNLIFQHRVINQIVHWWLKSHDIPVLDWVSQSSDLNPVENLWDYVDCQVRKRRPLPSSHKELIKAVQEEWANISIETLSSLILSMHERVKAVYKNKGRHINSDLLDLF
ncbi:5459_t:CDS:2 [Racocetra persica]|uniref:5459_t:CDS:1 n=1 Tax=Racocetra persica TaxID=160502 RepID=A0ACA9P1B5_9GLOM|nr:5459_t:CDS:2 [Racocetra persica]